jgi:hypothetical protein
MAPGDASITADNPLTATRSSPPKSHIFGRLNAQPARIVQAQLPPAQSRSDQRADGTLDRTVPTQEAQADRPFLSMRDRGNAGVTEARPHQLEDDRLREVEIEIALEQHAALAKIQDAAELSAAPVGTQARCQVFRVGATRRTAGELGELADRHPQRTSVAEIIADRLDGASRHVHASVPGNAFVF